MKIVINKDVDRLLKSSVPADIIMGMIIIKPQFKNEDQLFTYFSIRKSEYHYLWNKVGIVDFWYNNYEIYL